MRLTPHPQFSSPRLRSRLGFSAVEMLAVLTLMGIMLVIMTPALLTFYNSMKVKTASHRLMSHLRLCRQVAVSSRGEVVMELQRTESGVRPTYFAWQEKDDDETAQDEDGADGDPATDDDEITVVKRDNDMAGVGVAFVDMYNDANPADDQPGTSVADGAGIMRLRFLPNGQIMRIAADGSSVQTDTLLRMRLERQISPDRIDQHDITCNRTGKVDSDFKKIDPA